MSRLEQMRQHFLQRVHSEQQQLSLQFTKTKTKSSLNSAKSIQNISNLLKISPGQSQLRRTPSCLQASSYGYNNKFIREHSFLESTDLLSRGSPVKTNLSRVKSLNSISSLAPSRLKPKSVSSKQSESTKRNLTPIGNETQANNAKVNRPNTTRAAPNGSRALSEEQKRATTNSSCKHCDRTFSAKDRLDKHVNICAKTLHKQRPIFNSAKQRFKGQLQIDQSATLTVIDHGTFKDKNETNECASPKISGKEPHWKNAHQQLIEAIKKAKQKQLLTTKTDKMDDECLMSIEENFKYCSYCKRTFGVNVIIKHETICGKLFRKKHFNV